MKRRLNNFYLTPARRKYLLFALHAQANSTPINIYMKKVGQCQ